LIKYTLIETANKLELRYENTRKFIQAFIHNHIKKQMPLGIITNDTLAPFENNKHKHKYAPLVHHNIISAIYKKIWLTSRVIQHESAIPIPPPIQPPTLTKTIPISDSLLNKKIQLYIMKGQSSLHQLIKD
jgi:hypothetical protein